MVCNRYPRERRYYETILKRKCFRKLRDNVWERKTKWTLLHRADCQYRIKLLQKCIYSWLEYLNERYKAKINRRLAEMHYEGKLKWKVIFVLKKMVEQNWVLIGLCGSIFEWNLKYKSWHQWKHYVEKRLKVREVKLLADRIRRERMRIRFFYLWLFRMREKRSLEDAYREAARRHDFKMKRKYFNSWRILTHKLICKVKIEKLAIACYEDKLKLKSLRCWKRHTFQRKRYKYQLLFVRDFYERFLMRNYIGRWLTTYKKLKAERKVRNFNLAVSFHDRRLMGRCFRILWKVRERKREVEERAEMFRGVCLRIYLGLWLERRTEKIVWNVLEVKARNWRESYLTGAFLSKLGERHRERLEEREEMGNAVKYYNAVVAHKVFREWRGVVVRKVDKKAYLDSVYKLHLNRITKKTFEKWKKFVEIKSRKKMAVEYHRLTIFSKIINRWKDLTTERKIRLAEAKNLERKHNMSIMKQTFECWCNETKISKSKLASAVNFCDRTKLSRAFSAWRRITRTKAANRARYNRNKTLLGVILVKHMIFRWYEMHSVKQNLKRKLQELRVKQEKRALGAHFGLWRGFVEKMKVLQQNADAYQQLRAKVVLKHYLKVFREVMRSEKTLKDKEQLAKRMEVKLLKRRCLRKWVAFVCWKREKILSYLSSERKPDSKESFHICVPVCSGRRRKPMIPDYLKDDVNYSEIEGEC